MALNQKVITQYKSQANSPKGAYLLFHFIVKELGKDLSFHCILFLELKKKIEL
ncbi:hypothetical protein VINI7043_02195 [Vibrio nigripulchritudo ATCC 27043]|nr:hypothetical protein VINI7043_02195 [Vibrio nigripulchritudo ATCC 27043]